MFLSLFHTCGFSFFLEHGLQVLGRTSAGVVCERCAMLSSRYMSYFSRNPKTKHRKWVFHCNIFDGVFLGMCDTWRHVLADDDFPDALW
jgi:hypothetical protein